MSGEKVSWELKREESERRGLDDKEAGGQGAVSVDELPNLKSLHLFAVSDHLLVSKRLWQIQNL